MRIYYNPNDNIECPFINNGKSVGSKACKNCKYCYGKDFSKFTNYAMIPKDKKMFSLIQSKYILCDYPEHRKFYKAFIFIKKIIYKLFRI